VVDAATELARFTGRHLIASQAILFRAYLEQYPPACTTPD
jgi:hypothetical protein